MELETDRETVDNLKKVTLKVEAGVDAETMNLTPEPVRFEFVFGVGATGLTPFEYDLASKAPGDEIRLRISALQWCDYFRHLAVPGLAPPKPDSAVHLNVKIDGVRTAAGREVVKALAEMAECGGCDCGCGGHGGCDAGAGPSLEP